MRRTRLGLAVAVAFVGSGCWAAQASAYVYWTNFNSTTIARANLDGTSPTQSVIPGATAPAKVAVNGQYIYWTNYGINTIGRANLDGTGVNQSFINGASGPS